MGRRVCRAVTWNDRHVIVYRARGRDEIALVAFKRIPGIYRVYCKMKKYIGRWILSSEEKRQSSCKHSRDKNTFFIALKITQKRHGMDTVKVNQTR